MGVIRWIIMIAGITLLWIFGLKAAGAGLAEAGGLSTDAFKNIVLVVITYLSVRLFFKTSK